MIAVVKNNACWVIACLLIVFHIGCTSKVKPKTDWIIRVVYSGNSSYVRDSIFADSKNANHVLVKSFYGTGILKSTGTFFNEKSEGWFIMYYSDGTFADSVYYKKGVVFGSHKGP